MNKPPFPKAFSAIENQLGAAKRYFPVKKSARVGSLVSLIILSGGSILVFLYGLAIARAAYQRHGFALIGEKLTAPAIIALVLLALGLAAGRHAYVNWRRGVAVYERGFAVRGRKGIQVWRWEQVVALTAAITRRHTIGIYTGTTHVYRLDTLQKQALVLRDLYTNVEELARIIQEAIFPTLYARAAQQYNAGQSLIFGPVTISKAGIRIGKKEFSWTEVQQVSIRQGNLKVAKKDGGWFSGASAPTSTISNLSVLISILRQVAGIKVG